MQNIGEERRFMLQMMKTTIVMKTKIELDNPILIEGLPGLGIVGKISTRYLIKQLKTKKLAELYSPHFLTTYT